MQSSGPAPVTLASLRAFLGTDVVVETATGRTPARLLSAVRDSAWFVTNDTDLVVQLDDIVSVRRL
jgi:hypothetical protein